MSDCKEIMREVTDKFCDRLDEIFKYDREWMVKELKTLFENLRCRKISLNKG
jgi:hypothetical protein